MLNTIRQNKILTCGCCGSWFPTWNGYQDQDQDEGYGICAPCQGSIEQDEQKQIDKIITLLLSRLNEKNAAKLRNASPAKQRRIAHHALDTGIIKWSIGRA